MIIRVGSKNPVKVEAVQECFPDWEVEAVACDSGVQKQPLCLDEIIEGSRNRAKWSPSGKPFWGIGIESGVMHADHTGDHASEGWINTIACSIWDGERFSLGLAGGFVVPFAIMKIVMEEMVDLSEASRRAGLTAEKRIGYKEGIVSILTDGKMARKPYIKQAIVMAMIQVDHPELY